MFNAAVSKAPPTVFPELNELLLELVSQAGSILEDDFVGAYLTGSFALGAGDVHSDCDFLVVLGDRPTPAHERALRELHDEIPTRAGYWSHNLEGSYAPSADLVTLAALDEQWLYIDRGWREMRWSTHCNTAESRWTLRERGITLAGPSPHELVAEVPADVLRRRMPPLIESFLPDLFSWINFDTAWAQRYAVATLCRMLYTLDSGEVISKPGALEWAREELAPEWHDLFEQTLHDLGRGWDPDDSPRPGSVEATIAFAHWAKNRAG